MPARSYREWLATVQRANSSDELKLYLKTTATSEGWQSEYKAAAHDPDFGMREAVAALSNARGGEVFIGVDNEGEVIGSPVTLDTLNSTLQQVKANRAPWRITDLLLVVVQITRVPVQTGSTGAYVIELRSYDLPCFVLEGSDRLTLPVRSGNSTLRYDCASAIEFHLARRRSVLLRACLAELKTFSLQLSQHRALDDGLPDPLPFIHSIVQDGTAYTILTESDRTAIFGAGSATGRASGAVDTYYRAVRRIRHVLENSPTSERNVPVRSLPVVGQEFGNLETDVQTRASEFENYIRAQGISTDI